MRVLSAANLSVAFLAIALGACTSASTDAGRGAVLGAFAGSQSGSPSAGVAAMATMTGGLAAGPAGAGLGDNERRTALEAEYRALEFTATGQPVTWRTADGGFAGQVIAAAPYRVGSQDCRQYTHTLSTRAGTETARGTACRNSDGSWSLLS
jgi:surface antigen